MSFSIPAVKQAARGRWAEICSTLCPQLEEAMAQVGRHCACPVHGGKDGFRLFPDFRETGGGYCATCGAKTDGFELVSWLNGWTLPHTIETIGRYLGMSSRKGAGKAYFEKGRNTFRVEGLIETFGTAPYKFDESNADSPYVRLRTLAEDGVAKSVVLWGKDLARALGDAHLGEGSWVEIMRLGTEHVTLANGARAAKGIWAVKSVKAPVEGAQWRRDQNVRESAQSDRRKALRIIQTWAHTVPISTSDPIAAPVVKYLKARKIYLGKNSLEIGDSLRAGPPSPFYNEENSFLGNFPTMTAAVRAPDEEGTLVTLHRTFLTEDGRKIVATHPKRIMGLPAGRTIKGAAVRLGRPKVLLAVAEGIETALSVIAALRIPCWAALSANGLENFEPPSSVRMVLIMADNDRSETGMKAARALRHRLIRRGLNVLICSPREEIPPGAKGVDWNDVLMRRGPDGFPKIS